MAKPKKPQSQGFSFEGYDRKQFSRSDQYAAAIDQLYNAAIADFAKLANQIKLNPDKIFSFDQLPSLQAKAQQIVNDLASKMTAVIQHGSKESWLYACKKNDAFLAHIMNTAKIGKRQLKKMQDKNLTALDAFQQRKVSGMDLSQRVWRYAGETKNLIEMGLDVAIGDGKPAADLAKDLKQYLKEPDKLFRRVRDKHGNLQLSQRAAAYHPGRGVYRSSYQNALRLTRTEINMAYRDSDRYRWNQLDFVVGYEVKLSNNHTTKDPHGFGTIPLHDICDEFAGRYPKTFVFKGWHPNCRCYCVPILKDPKEFKTDQEKALHDAFWGDDDDFNANEDYRKYMDPNQSVNAVTDVPKAFKEWAAKNKERSKGWAKQPYFIKDNFTGGTLDGDLKIVKPVIPKPKDDPNEGKWNEFKNADEDTKNDIRSQMYFDLYNLKEQITNGSDGNPSLISILKKYGVDHSLLEKTINDLFEIVNTPAKDMTKDQILRYYQGMETAKSEIARLEGQLKTLAESMFGQIQPLITKANESLKRVDHWYPDLYFDGIDHMNNIVKVQEGHKYPDWTDVQKDAQDIIDECEKAINVRKDQMNKTKERINVLISDGEKYGIDNSIVSGLKSLYNTDIETSHMNYPQWKKSSDENIKKAEDAINNAKAKANQANGNLQSTIDNLEKAKIDYREVKMFDKDQSDEDIIRRVGGGDRTSGSCSSLALTFAANRGRMDVLDFRDGESREYFSRYSHISEIVKSVGGLIEHNVSGLDLMKKTEIGKEYYLAIGRHAAIVRQVSKGKYQYLELQSSISNGWKDLNAKVFGWRFSAKGRVWQGDLCEISLLYNDATFRKVMGYINTAEDKQVKGQSGTIK